MPDPDTDRRTAPAGKPVAHMRWWNLLFLHWPVPADELRPLVPPGLEIDTFDGTAWIGLIPFSMSIRAKGALGVLPAHCFHECNVRTYVTHDRGPGVWFFSLDAASRAAVWGARRFWHLNYQPARIDADRSGDTTSYALGRLTPAAPSMQCEWRAEAPRPPARAGALDFFLTERYLLYAADPTGGLHAGPIHHEPWVLREATVLSLEDELVAAGGVSVAQRGAPLAYHADTIEVDGWSLEKL